MGMLRGLLQWAGSVPQDDCYWIEMMRCYLIAPLTFLACLAVSLLGVGLFGYLLVAGLVALWAHGRAREIVSARQELEQVRQALQLYVASQERVAAIRKSSS